MKFNEGIDWQPGERVRILKHDNVVQMLWGRYATVAERVNDAFCGVFKLRLDDGNVIQLWGDQIEKDVLGELASL